MTDPSMKISEFCEAERVSRSMLYKLWSQGISPDYFEIGSTKRISPEARLARRRAREAAAKARAEAKREENSAAA